MNILTLLGRAFSSNLQAITVTPEEQTEMVALGAVEPTSQRYLAWRRAIILVVVIATVLSAGLTTFRTLTEDDDEPELIETVTELVLKKMETIVPGAASLVEKASSSTEETATAEKTDKEDEQPLFGRIVDGVELLSLYALPLAAIAVSFLRNKVQLSFRILVAGFAIGFLMPMAIGLLPWSVWGQSDGPVSPKDEPVKYLKNEVEGVLEGIQYLGMLLPTVLSLMPGALKSCLRLKSLLRESLLLGWFIVVASAIYSLFVLVVIIAIEQVTSEPLLLGGLSLFMLGTLVYALRAGVFTRPFLTEEDFNKMRGVMKIAGLITLGAGVLLLFYFATKEIFGIRLMDKTKSLLDPLDLVEFALQFVSRSLFVTLLGAELFMRMDLTAWKHGKTLEASDRGPVSDRTMESLDQVAKA